jgi:predicted DNA-binding protein (MmcQ/YjbR family)
MSLFRHETFNHVLGAHPGVTFVDQWDSRVAKVGGKVFALLGSNVTNEGPRIVFKVSEESFEILTAIGGIDQAPYFAKRQWVSASERAGLTENELETYVLRSYRLVARGLTRKLRVELGIPIE